MLAPVPQDTQFDIIECKFKTVRADRIQNSKSWRRKNHYVASEVYLTVCSLIDWPPTLDNWSTKLRFCPWRAINRYVFLFSQWQLQQSKNLMILAVLKVIRIFIKVWVLRKTLMLRRWSWWWRCWVESSFAGVQTLFCILSQLSPKKPSPNFVHCTALWFLAVFWIVMWVLCITDVKVHCNQFSLFCTGLCSPLWAESTLSCHKFWLKLLMLKGGCSRWLYPPYYCPWQVGLTGVGLFSSNPL